VSLTLNPWSASTGAVKVARELGSHQGVREPAMSPGSKQGARKVAMSQKASKEPGSQQETM